MDEQKLLRCASFSLTRLAAAATTSASTPLPHETLITISPSHNNSPTQLAAAASPISGSDSSVLNNGWRPEIAEISGRRSPVYNGMSQMTTSSSEENDEEEGDDNKVDDGKRTGRLQNNNNNVNKEKSEVLRCTSNANFDRAGSYHVGSKMRSRLMDPLPERKSGLISTRKSGMVMSTGRSGLLRSHDMSGKAGDHVQDDEEEEDPFLDDDYPKDYYKNEPISLIVIIEWVILAILITSLICSLTLPVLKEKDVLNLSLWKWEVLILVLICGRLVSGWCIKLTVFLITRNFMQGKRVLYFVYGLKKPVRNCVWLGLALLTWQFLFDRSVEREANTEILHYVTRVLDCFLIGSVIWLVKTFVVKVLGSSFHVSAFFDRIQESLFNQYVMQTLSGPPVVEIQRSMLQEEEKMMAEVQRFQTAGAVVPPDLIRANIMKTNVSRNLMSGRIRASPVRSGLMSGIIKKDDGDGGGISVDHLQKLNQKNVSAWNMKKLIRIIRLGALDACSNDDDDVNGNNEIRSEVEAKAAAKKMFRNVARPRRKYIYLEDLLRFMDEEEAVKTLSLFEGGTENERISKSALKNWVVNAFKERRALSLTLNDTKTAVNKLHKMVKVLVSVIICLIWLVILNIATTDFLLFVTSQVVLVAFVFGNSCKNVFESIIFLFVVHPYDVGDRCEIEGVQMIVEEMNILTTVFLRYDNQKITYPNSVLATKPIHNYNRSPDMGDSVEFFFHILTPPEKISQVKQRIVSYVDTKKEHWYPNPLVILKDLEGLDKIKIAVWVQHRMNHHNMGERWVRRALLLEECVNIFRDLDIEYRCLPWNNINTMFS